MTLEESLKWLQERYPDATLDTWHQHANGGGWVQNNCTVDATSKIGAKAIVSNGSRVDGSRVDGSSVLNGSSVDGSSVLNGSRVDGSSWIKSPLRIYGTRHIVGHYSIGHLAIGCVIHTFSEWESDYEQIGRENGYTDLEISEYALHIQYAVKMARRFEELGYVTEVKK